MVFVDAYCVLESLFLFGSRQRPKITDLGQGFTMVLPEGAGATSLNRLFFNAPGAPPHLLLLPPENRL